MLFYLLALFLRLCAAILPGDLCYEQMLIACDNGFGLSEELDG